MAQSYSLGALGQFLTVNSAANTALFANSVSFGNSTVNTTINSTAFTGQANNALYLGGTLASGYQTTAGVNANIAAYLPTYTGVVNGSSYTISTIFVANTLGVYHTGTINTASYTVGATFIANSTTLNTNGAVINSTGAYVTGLVNSASYNIGIIFIANSSAVTINTIPISYGTSGSGAPTVTTRSTGTRFILYNSLSATSVDYALGIEAGYMWQSWPGPTQGLKWYSNTTQVMLANTTGFYYTGVVNTNALTTGGGYGSATGGVVANVTTIAIGNTSVNVSINSTTFSGTANNASYLGTQLPAYYTNATNITTGTLPYAQLGAAVVNTSGNFTVAGNLNFTGTNTYFSGKATYAANIVIGAGISIIDSTASQGTAGQVLTSNGSGNVYWSAAAAGVNVAAQYTWTNTHTFANTVSLNNDKSLRWQTVNTSAYAAMRAQGDDNFVFYTTNTAYGERAVFSIFANSITSNLSFAVRTQHAGGLYIPPGTTLIDSTGSQGAAGYVLTSNGSGNVYWTSAGAASVDQAANYTWSGLHIFNANLTIGATSELIINSAAGIYANGTTGTAGQVLTSTGSGNVYWSTVSGGGGGSFTNGSSVAVSNLAFTNSGGGSVGVAYSFINTTSNSLDTVFA